MGLSCLVTVSGFLHQKLLATPRVGMTTWMTRGSDGTSEPENEALEKELNELHGKWQYIHALRQRNHAQLESFVDADAQWAAMSDEDKHYLNSEKNIEQRMAQVTQELKAMRTTRATRNGDKGDGAKL